VLKSILKASIYIVCLAWSEVVFAAGLGGINVTSSLGQPLKAEIEVVSVEKSFKSTLRAKLASVDAYKSAGVDYPYGLPKLKFQIEERADGMPYVKVTTAQPVNEPFVTLMVELSWSSGKLLREYTFLLDPADYKAEQPKEEVKPIEPILAAPIVEPEPVPVPLAAPVAASEPVAAEPVTAPPVAETPVAEKPAATEPAPAVAPVAESAVTAAPAAEVAPEAVPVPQNAVAAEPVPEVSPAPMMEQPLTQEAAPATAAPADALSKEESIAEPASASEKITVVKGDTLSKIAAQIKPADVSLERMLVALYRENTSVFDGHNMNRIRAGKILSMPSNDAVQKLPQADAVEEIRAQAADWNVYRQKLGAVPAPRVEAASKQEASGKVSAAVIDKAIASKEPPKEVLKLSKGEAPNDKEMGGGKSSAQEKAIAKEEEAIARNKALKEAEERTAILEKNVQDMKRLAELKKESAPVAASAATPAVTLSAASAPKPASSVAEAKPKPKVAPVAPKVVEEPSLVDELLSNPIYLGGGAAVLLGLGGLGFMIARRGKSGGGKKGGAKKTDDVGSSTGRFATPVAPSPETGDFTHAAFQAAPAASAESEEVDPIGEADLFLTFGRDAQAEEVLKEALKKNPNNIPVKLKLLSIYVTRKDTNSFYTFAREIKESGDTSAWNQTVAMGRELDPSNPLYGGNGDNASAAPAAPIKADTATPAVDFDLGFGSPAAAKAASGIAQKTVVLDETPAAEKTAILSSNELRAATTQTTTMDFDITGTNPGTPAYSGGGKSEAPAAINMDDLVFDVTATHPRVPTTPAPVAAAPEQDEHTMTFTLDFPTDVKVKSVVPSRDLNFDEITLNLDQTATNASTTAAIPEQSKGEQWQEVATKLDLAKAYQEMGDVAGAREILDEVLRDGDAQQRESAQTLMQQLL
jgi:pilus assembly protein FimV